MKTTNYQNTFIEIAEDCTAKMAEVPPQKGDKKRLRIINLNYCTIIRINSLLMR
jgi:hypothetical protein